MKCITISRREYDECGVSADVIGDSVQYYGLLWCTYIDDDRLIVSYGGEPNRTHITNLEKFICALFIKIRDLMIENASILVYIYDKADKDAIEFNITGTNIVCKDINNKHHLIIRSVKHRYALIKSKADQWKYVTNNLKKTKRYADTTIICTKN
jgi:hypothetical protein